MSHPKETKSNKARLRELKKSLLSVWHRTPMITGGLVVFAISISVFIYAQEGLLIQQDPKSEKLGQVTETEKHGIQPQQKKQNIPKSQVPTSQMSAEPPQSTSAKPIAQEVPATSCDKLAKEAAKRTFDTELSAEKRLHKEKLSEIGKLSKLFSALGLARDKTETENTRHEATVDSITLRYKNALSAAQCLG